MDMTRKKTECQLLVLLIVALSSTTAAAIELNTYGFFDVEAEIGNKNAAAKRGTFDQHHLTLIWQGQVDPRFSVLFETSYEHGPNLSDGALEGKVYLPKAYCEYMQSDALLLRAGKFLPPFGIYNERHDATPTVIPTVLPQSVYGKHADLVGPGAGEFGRNVQAYPRFATGIWALGTTFADSWEFTYHAYLTNGRGANEHEADDNTNKGFGTRVLVTPPGFPRFGFSYYSDRNGSLDGARQAAFGADLEYSRGAWFLECGSILPQFEELDAAGTRSGSTRRARGGYVMAGYTLWDRTTPFAYFDRYDPDRDTADDAIDDATMGINHMLSDSVFLKAEIHLVDFEDPARRSYWNSIASLAVAF
jgi:hypothetical protein